MNIGPITINQKKRLVTGPDGKPIMMTMTGYLVLEALAEAKGKAVTRDDLCFAANRRPLNKMGVRDRTIDQMVFQLRQSLPRDEFGRSLIHSVQGVGYWMQAPDA